jgi:hypothetical protein
MGGNESTVMMKREYAKRIAAGSGFPELPPTEEEVHHEVLNETKHADAVHAEKSGNLWNLADAGARHETDWRSYRMDAGFRDATHRALMEGRLPPSEVTHRENKRLVEEEVKRDHTRAAQRLQAQIDQEREEAVRRAAADAQIRQEQLRDAWNYADRKSREDAAWAAAMEERKLREQLRSERPQLSGPEFEAFYVEYKREHESAERQRELEAREVAQAALDGEFS